MIGPICDVNVVFVSTPVANHKMPNNVELYECISLIQLSIASRTGLWNADSLIKTTKENSRQTGKPSILKIARNVFGISANQRIFFTSVVVLYI